MVTLSIAFLGGFLLGIIWYKTVWEEITSWYSIRKQEQKEALLIWMLIKR